MSTLKTDPDRSLVALSLSLVPSSTGFTPPRTRTSTNSNFLAKMYKKSLIRNYPKWSTARAKNADAKIHLQGRYSIFHLLFRSWKILDVVELYSRQPSDVQPPSYPRGSGHDFQHALIFAYHHARILLLLRIALRYIITIFID